jgi:hypothetical protein
MRAGEGLSATEAYVLLQLPAWDARKALKLGFMGLLAQGVLRIETEDRPGLIRTRHIQHLRVAADRPASLPPVAASLVSMVRSAEPGGLIKDVVRQCQRTYQRTLAGFIRDYVGPALMARGLAEPSRRRVLGIFSFASFARTPAGEIERIRLEGLMQEARSIPDFLDRDPAQAVAMIAALGAAILLVEELRPHYQALSQAMRPPDGGASDGGTYADGNWNSGDGLNDGGFGASLDFGGFDFGSIDLGAFDAGAFDSFDAGFSDAGGDGGGGDGGGDGGSSGC